MRFDANIAAILAVLLYLFKGALGHTDHNLAHPDGHGRPTANSYDSFGNAYDTSQTKYATLAHCMVASAVPCLRLVTQQLQAIVCKQTLQACA